MQKYYSRTLKKYKTILLLSLLVLISIYACSEIEAVDVSDEIISSVMPTENTTFTTNTVNFRWSEIEDADKYQILIVKPNFTNPVAFSIDSIVTSANVNFTLSPSNYQWKVRGINNISETNYTEPINFQVDEVIELTDQTVTLNSPQEGIYLNNIQTNFTWDYLTVADSYLFQLIRGDEFSNTIIEQNSTTSNYYLLSTQNLSEDRYTWKVRAVNSFSETAFFFRSFYIDTTVPNTPNLLSPNDSEIVSNPISFSWNLGVDGGTIHASITQVLEIATDVNFDTLFDSIEVIDNQLDYTFSTTGDFYWRVKAYDNAGNIGAYSESRMITVE